MLADVLVPPTDDFQIGWVRSFVVESDYRDNRTMLVPNLPYKTGESPRPKVERESIWRKRYLPNLSLEMSQDPGCVQYVRSPVAAAGFLDQSGRSEHNDDESSRPIHHGMTYFLITCRGIVRCFTDVEDAKSKPSSESLDSYQRAPTARIDACAIIVMIERRPSGG